MQLPIVKEISALSAHRREVELVRWSLMAVPDPRAQRDTPDPSDPLRQIGGVRCPTRPGEGPGRAHPRA